MHPMPLTSDLANYEIYPRVFLANATTTVTIRPLGGHVAFTEGARYLVRAMALDENVEPAPIEDFPSFEAVAKDGKLTLSLTLSGEQEYFIRLYQLPGTSGRNEHLCNLRVYAVLQDLYARRPFKGDLHIHSSYSDGKEAPAIVAANYRKAGFDFMGVTDHEHYAPSLEAIAAYADAPIDMALFPGEEVHLQNPYHIVNFGGSFSLSDYYREHKADYEAQVHALATTLHVPPGLNATTCATMLWAFNKIRETGGLAIYPHPHWVSLTHHVPHGYTDYLFTTAAFDAFELLGGDTTAPNNKQVALWNEMRASGHDVPIVASSDSHGTVEAPYFKWVSTIAFSPSLAWEDVRSSILAKYTVAVETYPNETPRFYGSYRLVKFAMFLWDTYFVQHDEACIEEGRQMFAHATGDKAAKEHLARLKGRSAQLLADWYRA